MGEAAELPRFVSVLFLFSTLRKYVARVLAHDWIPTQTSWYLYPARGYDNTLWEVEKGQTVIVVTNSRLAKRKQKKRKHKRSNKAKTKDDLSYS